ncbi:MAG: hypothetical protein E7071_00480 [Bacteroidales bacterium]|nr:hypothetical protein [Bacteroidales bacterium]
MKLNKILFPLCLVAALSVGCSSDSDSSDSPEPTTKPTEPAPSQPVLPSDSVPQTKPTVTIDLDTCELKSYSVFVDCMGGEKVIVVSSNRNYDVSANVSWITIKNSGRAVTESQVVIEIAENTEAEREGVVEFVMQDTQEPVTLEFVVKQTAAGVVFEDKTVNDAVNDMNDQVWHPNEITKTFTSGAGYHYGLSSYSEEEHILNINEEYFKEFFGITGSVDELIESGKMKIEFMWCTTNGSEWKVTSVKAPRLPEGYDLGASYRETGSVIPQSSTFSTMYYIGMKNYLQIVLNIDFDAIGSSENEYHAGVRYSMIDDKWGDTYIYDVEIDFTYTAD